MVTTHEANQPHEAAALFRMLGPDEFEALAADIKQHGLREPIKRLGGKILDGRNRLLACAEAGVEPVFDDLKAKDVGDPFAYVLSLNYYRRHLSALEKGRALRSYLERKGGKRGANKGGRPKKGAQSGHVSIKSVAKDLGVPRQTVERQIQAADDYDALPPPLQKKVDTGDVSVAVAKQAADRIPPAARARAKAAEAADEPLPDSVQKVFDDAAAQRREVNAFMTFLSRTASGFTFHDKTAMGRKWMKADRDAIDRDLASIRKHINSWRAKICP